MNQPNPEHILQVGLGFWASKTLLSAVEMGLFTIWKPCKSGSGCILDQRAISLTPWWP
jgi:hypothetical protein